ncbi:MAG: hypothetical protein R3F49_05050 [Planctomycetota bacterium]
MKTSLLALAASAMLFAAPTYAQVGQPLPKVDVEIIHPAAKNLDAYQGRLILVEFFAHW